MIQSAVFWKALFNIIILKRNLKQKLIDMNKSQFFSPRYWVVFFFIALFATALQNVAIAQEADSVSKIAVPTEFPESALDSLKPSPIGYFVASAKENAQFIRLVNTLFPYLLVFWIASIALITFFKYKKMEDLVAAILKLFWQANIFLGFAALTVFLAVNLEKNLILEMTREMMMLIGVIIFAGFSFTLLYRLRDKLERSELFRLSALCFIVIAALLPFSMSYSLKEEATSFLTLLGSLSGYLLSKNSDNSPPSPKETDKGEKKSQD